MEFDEKMMLSISNMKKEDMESLLLRCIGSFPPVRIVFSVDSALSKLNLENLDSVLAEVKESMQVDEYICWRNSWDYDFVLTYVEISLFKHVLNQDFDKKIKKKLLCNVIAFAKERGVNIQEPYFWFEKVEELINPYHKNHASPGEHIEVCD